MGGFERKRDTAPSGIVPKPIVDVSYSLLTEKPGTATLTTHQARSVGFTGNPCPICESMRMVHTGHCDTCQECGNTTGCS